MEPDDDTLTYQQGLRDLGGAPGTLNDLEDAEIQADLEAQGLDQLGVTVDNVRASFSLYQRVAPPDEFGPPPSPAAGEKARYAPEPGEEDLFADTSDMYYPPEG
jgi:hypothetical protein